MEEILFNGLLTQIRTYLFGFLVASIRFLQEHSVLYNMMRTDDIFLFQLFYNLLVIEYVLGDYCLGFCFYSLEKYLQHPFNVLHINCFEQKKSKETSLNVFINPHKCSHMPPIDGILLLYSKKTTLSIFLIIFLHKLIDDNNRLCYRLALSLISRLNRICQYRIPFIF